MKVGYCYVQMLIRSPTKVLESVEKGSYRLSLSCSSSF